MLSVHVKNYRGLANADLDLSPIAQVSGLNGAGKTSLAQAIGSVILGDSVVLDGFKTSEAGMLVRVGAAKAEITVTGPSGTASITLPSGRLKTSGERPPRASRFALGLACLLDLDPRERSKVLLEYLQASPTKEDLAAALPELPAQLIDLLWQDISAIGWDGAHAKAKDKGARLKGQWEAITGDNYGSKKAEDWLPQGWSPDLGTSSLDALSQEVADAQRLHDAAIAASAVSAEERQHLIRESAELAELSEKLNKQRAALDTISDQIAAARGVRQGLPDEIALQTSSEQRRQLEALANRSDELTAAIAEKSKLIASLKEKLEQLRNHRASLPGPEALTLTGPSVTGICPHCKQAIEYRDGKFSAAHGKPTAAAPTTDRRRAIKKADDDIYTAEVELERSQRDLGRLEADLSSAMTAKTKLESLPDIASLEALEHRVAERLSKIQAADAELHRLQAAHGEAQRILGHLEASYERAQAATVTLSGLPPETVSDDDLNRCREAVRTANSRLANFRTKTEADRLSASIRTNQAIVAALSATGERQRKLSTAFSAFNERLATLATAAGWKMVEFGEDLKVSYGGREYRLCSASEQYRVRAIVQAAFAQLDGSDLVIFDGADILDSGKPADGVTRGRPGLLKLCSHLKVPSLILMTLPREQVPDLARLGLGRSYYVNAGVVEALGASSQAA